MLDEQSVSTLGDED